jgi:ligand-binding SRPBCC domain-containing protein
VTLIHAPIQICFDFARSIDLELRAAEGARISAVDGVRSGLIGPGERVGWRARQFGLWIRHTSEITGFDSPGYFQDSMIQGIFRTYEHRHYFLAVSESETEMRDEVWFSMPWWLLGPFAERLMVQPALEKLLVERNRRIKLEAEAA